MDRSEWARVPRELNESMFVAGYNAMAASPMGDTRKMLQAVWNAQIAAAPPPPAEQASGEFHARFTAAANAICATYKQEVGREMLLSVAERLSYAALKAAGVAPQQPEKGETP